MVIVVKFYAILKTKRILLDDDKPANIAHAYTLLRVRRGILDLGFPDPSKRKRD